MFYIVKKFMKTKSVVDFFLNSHAEKQAGIEDVFPRNVDEILGNAFA